jgi:hypothetical protein
MEHVALRSPHTVEVEILTMGLHDLGVGMRSHVQARIDAADNDSYDAILLGYGLCGRGTEGLRAGKTPLVIPRAHDCITLLMGDRAKYTAYFEDHPGVYYRSPGWVEFQTGQTLQPASANNMLGERRTREEFIAQYGEENGEYLYQQFTAYRRRYSGLTYISTGVAWDSISREKAKDEAAKQGWSFEEVKGSLVLLERMVNGDWDSADFLVVPPGASVRGVLGEMILEAV